MHGQSACFCVGVIGHYFALDEMRVLEDLRDIIDWPDGHAGLFKKGNVRGLRVPADIFAEDGVEFLRVLHPARVGAEARIFVQLGASDGAKDAFRHALGGSGEGDVLAVLGCGKRDGGAGTFRGAELVERLPVRGLTLPVSR